MTKYIIDSTSRSHYNGQEVIHLDEDDWMDFLKHKQEEEKEGWIKLVELSLDRKRAEQIAAL